MVERRHGRHIYYKLAGEADQNGWYSQKILNDTHIFHHSEECLNSYDSVSKGQRVCKEITTPMTMTGVSQVKPGADISGLSSTLRH